MNVILAWISLGLLVAACAATAIVGLKRSAWWGPRRSALEPLDEREIRFSKCAGVLFVLAVAVGLIAVTIFWMG